MAHNTTRMAAESSTEDTKRKPVILQVLPELQSGGVERGVIEVTKACKAAGMDVVVASAGGRMLQQVVSAGGKHVTLPLASKNPFTIIRNIWRLAKVIREYHVDVVHARSRAPAWSAYFAAKKTGVRFITTFHGVYSFKTPLKRWYNSVMTKGEYVIAASQFIYDHIVDNYKISKKTLKLIPRGVDLDQFDLSKVPERRVVQMAARMGIEHDAPLILMPGRLTRWKGHEFLLDALALLRNEPWHCLFVGDDNRHQEYRKRLEKRIKALGLEGKVRIWANVQDMPAIYSLADIVVSASLRPESFGRVSTEAQAMGRLVIATNHGGSRETIIQDKTGWLVEPGDVENMAKALHKAMTLSQRTRKTMANRAKKHIKQNFSLEQMVKKTLELYGAMVA